ncbi:hypothetical protein ABFS83_10G164800 [Erythranthe nasuta]
MAGNRHSSGKNGPNSSEVVVVMVPLPAQGHLNQLLQLSRIIAAYNIPVHYVSTSTHIRQAKLRDHGGWDPRAATNNNLHFHGFPVPEYHSPNPNPNAANKFPSHLQPLFNAASHHLRPPLAALLRSLSGTSRRVVVIHDSLMASVVQDVGSVPDAESYVFHSVSAFAIFWYFCETLEKTEPKPTIETELQNKVPSLEDCFTTEFMDFIVSEHRHVGLSSGSLYNSCRSVEGRFMDLIEKISGRNKKHWSIGPFNPVGSTEKKSSVQHRCLKWLDEQESRSVIYVSFGTTTSFSDEQIKELANGLEESGAQFIWVLRDADKGDLNENGGIRKAELPVGFEDRVRERGIVVREWVPQLAILRHSSTGGFMSHCGWNSCMESISMGVPIAAWPMHSDQPRNAVLITEVLKIGVVVMDWGRRDEVVTAEAVAVAVKRLMGSEEMRRRAEELGGDVRSAVAEGGVTWSEMDSFVAHISR